MTLTLAIMFRSRSLFRMDASAGFGSIAMTRPRGPTAAEAANEKASYIVMGGFGHRRFVEAIFGGVTREMLGESPVPLVLAH